MPSLCSVDALEGSCGSCDYSRLEGQGSPDPLASSPGKGTEGKVSLRALTMNVIVAGLGTGILSLPWATAGTSLLPSLALIAAVMALNAATVMIVILAAERTQAFDLGSLLGHLPGRYSSLAQAFCNALTWASVFLCLVGYIVVIADSLEPLVLLGLHFEAGEDTSSVRSPLMILGAIAVLPLCFLDQEHLSFSSGLGIAVNVYMFCLVLLVFTDRGVAPDICVVGAGPGVLTLFSTLMQCGAIQMCVPPMYEELRNRSPQRFSNAIVISFGFLAVLFSAFSVTAYLAFGPGVQSNVMMNFPDDTSGNLARVGMVVVTLAVYPILLKSMVAPIQHWERSRYHSAPWRWHWVVLLIVIGSVVGGHSAGSLGRLQSMNGALQVSAFIAVAPSLSGLFLLGLKGWGWKVTMCALLVFGIAASLLGLIYTSNQTAELTRNCVWTMRSGAP